MSACKTLVRTSLSSITSTLRTNRPTVSLLHSLSLRFSPLPPNQALRLAPYNVPSRPYASISSEAAVADFTDEAHSPDSTLEPSENPTQDTVEELLRKKNDVACVMKMERHHESVHQISGRWFPYLYKFSCGGGAFLNSGEVLEVVDPYIMDVRKDKFRKMVKIRATGCVWWLKNWEISTMYRHRFSLQMRSSFSWFMWYPATPKGATTFEVKGVWF